MRGALVGLPNSGKSTLFNRLTGAHQHIGNFPGVTVERASGTLRGHPEIELVDLPGLYSLFPYTAEEAVARDDLLENPPDFLLQVLDATCPERHLYLTTQLLELGVPTVLALNLMDVAQASGRTYDLPELEKRLGVPVFPVCASDGDGVDALTDALCALPPAKAGGLLFADSPLGRIRESFCGRAEPLSLPHPAAFLFSCAVMGEEKPLRGLPAELLSPLRAALPDDPVAEMVRARYAAVDALCDGVTEDPARPAHTATRRADRVLTHRVFAVPIFFCLLFAVFLLTFRVFGAFLQDLLGLLLARLSDWADAAMRSAGVADTVRSLVVDGVLAGVGSVLLFLPTVLSLFFFLSLLEDSGYLARVAFVLDRPMRRFGLSGRALVPALLGFGCTVPAVLATRTLSSRREKLLTVLLLPFVACSAKIPLLTLLCGAFFPRSAPWVLFALYLFGVSAGLLSTALLSRKVLKGSSGALLLELPPYRLPSLGAVTAHTWERGKAFVKRAFTVLLLASVAVWALRRFDTSFRPTSQENSLLAACSRRLSPVFAPLGFGDWRLIAALFSGLSAKEAVVSTLSVLFGAGEGTLARTLQSAGALPGLPAALSFLVFFLLYLPCFAAMGAMAREFGKRRYAVAAFAYQLAVAWVCAFVVYRVALLLT